MGWLTRQGRDEGMSFESTQLQEPEVALGAATLMSLSYVRYSREPLEGVQHLGAKVESRGWALPRIQRRRALCQEQRREARGKSLAAITISVSHQLSD